MAVPGNPTVSSLVTDALRNVLTAPPTAGQELELTNNGFQNVKTEIWFHCAADKLLSTTCMVAMSQGSGQVTLPSDFDHVIEAVVYTCSEDMSWTATTGTTSTITAPSTFSTDVSSIRGLYLFTIAGTGDGQYRQITGYDNTTKIITVTPDWTTAPDATTQAFIGTQFRLLANDERYITWNQGTPTRYRLTGTTSLNSGFPVMELSPVPDVSYYAMLLTYGPNLTRLDESGSLFVKHLRERRALWVQGLKAQAAYRYDEARYGTEEAKFQLMLKLHSAHNVMFSQVSAAR